MLTVKTKPGRVKTLSKSFASSLTPSQLLEQLLKSDALASARQQKPNRLLLESCDISTRENSQSIIMLQAALRMECLANQVTVKALTTNGEQVIKLLSQHLASQSEVSVERLGQSQLCLSFPKQSGLIDEDSKLQQTSVLDALRRIQHLYRADNQDFGLFLCGVFAYDLLASFEQLPQVETGFNDCPDYVIYLAETLVVFDHQSHSQRLLSNCFLQSDTASELESRIYQDLAQGITQLETSLKLAPFSPHPAPETPEAIADPDQLTVKVNLSDQAFIDQVNQLKRPIIDGDIFQVVPSRRFQLPCLSPFASYQKLKQTNPSPYLFYLQDESFTLFGASPESALKYTASSRKVSLYPIAGTRPRGKNADGSVNPDLDARMETSLKLDPKEIAEHLMLVDLARNDIARIARPATTRLSRLLEVDKYSEVMHLVSCVEGELRQDLDALHAYQASMNMGTLTGAPKLKASQLIRKFEQQRRGSYGGAIGYLNGRGDMDSCIIIRAAFCKNGLAEVQAGAGIVFDSDPDSEARETRAKAQALINAIQQTNQSLHISQSLQTNQARRETHCGVAVNE